jgi:pimeloyl-ACP methyl ester carboxylesterase
MFNTDAMNLARIHAVLLLCLCAPLASFAGHGTGHHSFRSYSTRSHHHGWYHRSTAAKLALFAEMSKNAPMLADNVKKSPLATMYPKTNWETSFRKMGELASTPFDWAEQVKALKLPTLLVFADADAVRAEHIVEFYKALGGAQRDARLDGSIRSTARLAILPGTTHYDIIASPSLAVVIGEFLKR